jgi:hypothetical protein
MKTAKTHNDQLTGRLEPLPPGVDFYEKFLTQVKELRKDVKAKRWTQHVYNELSECVDDGLEAGWSKAREYSDQPTKEELLGHMRTYIMLNIAERYDFK